jgi:hypothetical protein
MMVELEEDQDPGVVLIVEQAVKHRIKVSKQDANVVLQMNLWVDDKGYVRCSKTEDGYIYLHNFLMKHSDPTLPIDHINENRRDNRRSNLRILPRDENTQRPVRRDEEEDRLLQDYADGKLDRSIHEVLRERRNRSKL